MRPVISMAHPHTSLACDDRAPRGFRHLPRLRILKNKEQPRAATYPIFSIERAFENAGVPALPSWMTAPDNLIANIVYKFRWMWNFRRSPSGPVFVSYMSYLEKKTFPFSYWTEIIPYTFDCWPIYYDMWASFYRRQRVRLAFITARQSTEYFASLFPEMTVKWIPEAVDPSEYEPTIPLADRDIDVLEMGRRYDPYHHRIAGSLANKNRTHIYDRGDKSIFAGRAELISGLAHTKILICFPRSLTNPETAGTVETVTYRYFQAMASKCLIIGRAPKELIDLYGYNPVIEVSEGHEIEQLDWVLRNLDSLSSFVERNYVRLLEVGTWERRISTILDILRQHSAFRESA